MPSRRRPALALALLAAAMLLVAALLLRREAPPPRGAPATGARAAAAPSAPAPVAVPPRLPITVPAAPPGADDALPGTFEGRVVSRADGRGVAGADLTFSRGGAAASVRAGPDGAFRFEPPADGRWLLAAVTAPGFLPFAPEWGHSPVQLDARAGRHVRGIAIHLAPAAELVGRVVDQEGGPAPGAEVRLLGLSGEAALVSVPDRFTADERGEFRFSAPEGAVVEARRPGFSPGRAVVDLVATVEGRVTVTLGPAHDAAAGEPARIGGRVVARGGGAAIPGALVVAEREARFGGLGPAVQAAAGADGTFELRGLDPGRYRVTAQAEGRAPASATRVAAGTADVLLELGEGARLRGCVRDRSSGAPVAPFTVVVFSRGASLFRALEASRSFVDASGCYALDDLSPGPAAVVISAPGYAPSPELAVDLSATGEAVADAAVERGGRLAGTVLDADTRAPLGGARLSVEGALADAASTFPVLAAATTDAAGRFVLDGLPRRFSVLAAAAGHHARVVAGEPDGPPVEIPLRAVAPGETPKIELAGIGIGIAIRGNALAVTGVIPRGGAAEAGLAPGDLVLRVDGVPVEDLGFQGAVDAIRGPEGTTVLLTLRRGTETIEVRVPRRIVRG
jgi:carboxypeptidase family protein/PDZ domain-containing protein